MAAPLDVLPVEAMLTLNDMEKMAEHVLPREAFAYFSCGAGDETTTRENVAAWQRRVHLIPRVLVDVADAATDATVLGVSLKLPLFVSAAARGKLAHPEGEACITRACCTSGIAQMVPQLGGATLEEVTAAAGGSTYPRWLQLYVHKDRTLTLALIRRAERLGFTALVITVDAPTVGKRLRDIRARAEAEGPGAFATFGSAPRGGSSLFDERLDWSDLAWFRRVTTLPLVLKGVQCGADAVLALKHGCAAVVVSNHGGRNLDGCRPTLVALDEVVAALALADCGAVAMEKGRRRMQVWVDGGIRTGADVVKALALGASAVGIGRPVMYGLASYGQTGVERVIQLLQTEMLTTMKLMGVSRVRDITRACIEASDSPLHLQRLPPKPKL